MQPTEPHLPKSLDQGSMFLALLDSLSNRLRGLLSDEGFGPIEQLVAEAPVQYQATIFEELLIEEAQLRKMRGAVPTLEEYLQRFPSRARLVESAWRRLHSVAAPGKVDHRGDSNDSYGMEIGKPVTSDSVPTHFGSYKVLRPLGSGTFGSVYQAQNESTGEVVAIKVLKTCWARDPNCGQAMRRQFAEEAKMMLQFDHPHVVRVISLDEQTDPPYFVQEYIDGLTLDNRLQSGRMTLYQSVQYAIQIADGLAHIHSHECWHRDLKPANILLDRNNHLYLADFGLALDEAQRWSSRAGVAGTYPYMAPEQIKGATHRLNARCDIWALGVILYEMLTGRRPFRSKTREQLCEDVTQRTPPTPRELNQAIPRELNRLCMQCLSKRDADRPHAAADVRDDLAQILQTLDEGASPTGTAATLAKATQPDRRAKAESSVEYPIPTLKRFTAEQAELYLRLMPRGYATEEELPELITFWKTRIVETDPDQTFAVGIMVGVSGCGKSSMLEAGLVPSLPESVIPILIEASETETEVRILNRLRRALPDADPVKKWSLVDWTFRLRSGSVLPQGKKVIFVLDQFEQWLNAHGGEPTSPLLDALHQCDGEHLQAIVCVREGFHATLMRFVEALSFKLDGELNYATAHRFTPDHARFVLTQFGRGLKCVDNPPTSQQQAFIDATVDALAESDRGVVCVRLVVLALVMQDRSWSVEELNQLGGLDGIGSQFLVDCFEGRTSSEQYRRYLPAAMRVLAELLPAQGLEIKDVRSYEQLLAASELDKRQFDDLLNILVRKLFLLTPVEQVAVFPSTHHASPTTSSSSSLPPPASSLFYQLTHDFLVPSIRDWLSRKLRETKAGRAQLRLQEATAAWTTKPENRNLPSMWEWLTIRRLTDSNQRNAAEQTVMRRATTYHLQRLGLGAAAFVLLAVGGFFTQREVSRRQELTRMEGLVGQLISAEPGQLPEIVGELDESPQAASEFLVPLLNRTANSPDEKRTQLHAMLASVGRDPALVEPLVEELLSGKLAYVGPIREILKPRASQLIDAFWQVLRDETGDADLRFRAGLALADYSPPSESETDAAPKSDSDSASDLESKTWTEPLFSFMAEQLVFSNAESQPILRNLLRPIQARLLPELEQVFQNAAATEAQRLSAANAFADYAATDVAKLSTLLAVATPEQYAVIYPLVAADPTPTVLEDLGTIAATLPPEDMGSVPRIPYGQRRANAAVTMLRLGEREKVIPVFDWTDDPEALTQFIFRCKPRGIRVEELLDLLDFITRSVSEGASAPDQPRGASLRLSNSAQSAIHTRQAEQPGASAQRLIHARYALMLAIGEYAPSDIPPARREALVQQLADWYASDPSSGVHGAAGWLLRHLGEHEIVTRVDQTPIPYSPDREWFTLAITVKPTPPPKPKPKDKYETNESEAKAEESDSNKTELQEPEQPLESLPPKTFYYTFVVFPRGEYSIGSVADEVDRDEQPPNRELRHRVTLTRRFAILDREVMYDEMISYYPTLYGRWLREEGKPSSTACRGVDWYDSVAYCRWLGKEMGLPESEQCYSDPQSLDQEQYDRDQQVTWAPRNWPLNLDKRGFRLPTESEWEVVARSGSRTAYGFGSEVGLLERFGWFTENSGKLAHPPKKLRPSVRGLFDLHGNLFEWTQDWFATFRESVQTDPAGSMTGSSRVVRGGSWGNEAMSSRSAQRAANAPSGRSFNIGFRLALSLSSQVPAEPESGEVGAEPAGKGTEGVAEQRPEVR